MASAPFPSFKVVAAGIAAMGEEMTSLPPPLRKTVNDLLRGADFDKVCKQWRDRKAMDRRRERLDKASMCIVLNAGSHGSAQAWMGDELDEQAEAMAREAREARRCREAARRRKEYEAQRALRRERRLAGDPQSPLADPGAAELEFVPKPLPTPPWTPTGAQSSSFAQQVAAAAAGPSRSPPPRRAVSASATRAAPAAPTRSPSAAELGASPSRTTLPAAALLQRRADASLPQLHADASLDGARADAADASLPCAGSAAGRRAAPAPRVASAGAARRSVGARAPPAGATRALAAGAVGQRPRTAENAVAPSLRRHQMAQRQQRAQSAGGTSGQARLARPQVDSRAPMAEGGGPGALEAPRPATEVPLGEKEQCWMSATLSSVREVKDRRKFDILNDGMTLPPGALRGGQGSTRMTMPPNAASDPSPSRSGTGKPLAFPVTAPTGTEASGGVSLHSAPPAPSSPTHGSKDRPRPSAVGVTFQAEAMSRRSSAASAHSGSDHGRRHSSGSSGSEEEELGLKAYRVPSRAGAAKGQLINKRAIRERAMSRLVTQAHGLDEVEVARVRSAFWRFRAPLASEVHKDDLPRVLSHLGYTKLDQEVIDSIGAEVCVYSALDLMELCSFVERFAKYEVDEMRKMFKRFDEDGSGEISTDELRKFMSALGFTPLRSSIAEALAAVDEDGSGSLNFEETVHLLEVYKSTEGFTQPEVQALYDAFMAETRAQFPESEGHRPMPKESTIGIAAAKYIRGSGEADATGWTLPARRLAHVLLRHFGPSSLDVATRLGSEVVHGGGLSFAGATSIKPESVEHRLSDESAAGACQCQPLSFQEVLLWARRLREITFADWRGKFERYDQDGSGSIDREELQQVVQNLGYTVHKDVVEEYLEQADEDWEGAAKDGQLDYDEFVNFMLILRDHEGFSAAEQREIENVFTKFDTNHSGEIEVMELNSIFQYLGSVIRIEEVNKLLLKVDFNGSGSLDLREFRRLMRLHREDELSELREAFDLHAREAAESTTQRQSLAAISSGKVITQHEASEILSAMGYPDSLVDLSEGGVTKMASAPTRMASTANAVTLLTFDDVISMLNHRREVRVKEQRCCAGFTEHELKDLKIVFDRYDTDGSGVLSGKEVAPLLEQLGLSTGTVQDRERVLNEIDKARAMAVAAGVSDIGERGSGTMNFWELVQLLRLLYSHVDSQVLERENRAIEETQFKRAEVDDFREIFVDWLEKHRQFLAETRAIHQNQRLSHPRWVNSRPQEDHHDADALDGDAIRRLISSLGLRMDSAQRGQLEQKIRDFKNGGSIVFPDFLRLMRWMLDTDFAGLTQALHRDR